MTIMSKVLLLAIISISALTAPTSVSAAGATLYLTPSSGTFVIGKTFNVGVKVNSGGDVVNAAEGTISYDTNLLEVAGLSKGGSIFPFWTTEPSHSGGVIRFGGGLPPPAYNGTAGHLITITFRAKRSGGARVAFSSGAVLANDGKGTNILASMGSANYIISPHVSAPAQPSGEKAPAKQEAEHNKPKVTSPTHPDQDKWYSNRTVKFEWELPESVKGASISFDQKAWSDPGPAADGLFSEKEYLAEEDGVYYLHLKFKDSRRWGTIEHFQVSIDTVAPLSFEIEVSETEVGEWPKLMFSTKDELSGLER